MKFIKRVFIETSVFTKRWYELNLTDGDLSDLEEFIIKNPDAGDMIRGTGGLIKLRWNLPNKGKRGGARILYIDFVRYEKIFLVNCYRKKMTFQTMRKLSTKKLSKKSERSCNKWEYMRTPYRGYKRLSRM